MKIRIGISQRQSLIEPRGDQADRSRFRFAADVVARELEGSARTNETLLAYAELIAEANWRKARNDDRAHGNVAVSRNDFEPAADVHRIPPRLVDTNDDDLLAFVVCRRTHWRDTGPIENTNAVKIAFRLQKLLLAERIS